MSFVAGAVGTRDKAKCLWIVVERRAGREPGRGEQGREA